MTGPKPLPKRALHIVRSRASSFKWQHPLLSLRSSSSFLRLLPRLPVTSIPPFIFPSITRCRRQFVQKMWPTQLAFCLLISCRIFLCSLTLNNISSFLAWLVQLIFSSTTFQNFLGVSDFLYTVKKVMHLVLCMLTCKISNSYEQEQNSALITMGVMLCGHCIAILCWENVDVHIPVDKSAS